MTVLLMRAKNARLSSRLTTSAIRKAHHTLFTLPVRARSQAAGSSTTSWRHMETIRLNTPLPSAWNTDPITMPMPASKKCGQMMRSAGMPMASMASLAAKMPSTLSGKNWKMQKPISMMPSA